MFRNKEERQGVLCCFWCMYSGLGYIISYSRNLEIPMILFAIDWVLFLTLMIIYYIDSDKIYRKQMGAK